MPQLSYSKAQVHAAFLQLHSLILSNYGEPDSNGTCLHFFFNSQEWQREEEIGSAPLGVNTVFDLLLFRLFELLIFKSLEDELYYLKFIYSVNGMDAFESVTPLP